MRAIVEECFKWGMQVRVRCAREAAAAGGM
jgi:hypothetical protein